MLSRRGPLFTPTGIGDCKPKKKSGIMVRISRVLFPEIALESTSSAAPASRRISNRLVDMKCDCLVNLDQPATSSKKNKRKKVRSKSKRRQSTAKESDPNLNSNDKENEQAMPRRTRLSSRGINNSRRRSVGSSILTNLSSIQNTKTRAVRRKRAVKSKKKKDEAVGTTDKEHVNTTKTQQRHAQRNRRQSTSSVLENLSTLTAKENRVSFISPHTPIHESTKPFKASPVPWNSSKKISSPRVFEEDALTPSVAPKGAKRLDDKATPDFISGVNQTNKGDSQSVAVDNIVKTNSTTPVIVRDENRVMIDKCMQTPVQVRNQVMSLTNSMNRSCNMSLDSIVASPDDRDVRISSLNSRLMDVEVDEKVDRGKVETIRDENQDNRAFDSENVGVEPKSMEVGADMLSIVAAKSVNNTEETDGQTSETIIDVSEEKSSSDDESSKAKKDSEATLVNTCSSSPLQKLRRSARASKKVERLVVSFKRKSKTKSSEEVKETNAVDDNRKEDEETSSLSTNKGEKSFLKKAKSPVDKKSSNELDEREKVETQPSEARKSSRVSIPTERLTVRSFRVKAKKKKATTKKEREDGQDLIGARVAKFFCRKLYTGEVISFNGKYWKVRYKDEDEEDLSRHEVEAAISLFETKGKKKVKKNTSLKNKKGNDGPSLDEVSQKTAKSEPSKVLKNNCRDHDLDLLSNDKVDNTQSDPRKWTDDMVKSLKVAHSKADPTSISFWQDISRMVGGRSAEECRDKWFDFSGSLSRKTKKTGKNSSKAKVPNKMEEKDEDDLFSSTPMKLSNAAKLQLPSSKQKMDAKASTFNKVVDLFSSPLLNRRKKPEANCDSSEKKLFFRPQYKSYLNDIRIGRVGGIGKMIRVNKNDKKRHIRASVDDGDYEADASLSPGGTLRVKANFDDSDSEMTDY